MFTWYFVVFVGSFGVGVLGEFVCVLVVCDLVNLGVLGGFRVFFGWFVSILALGVLSYCCDCVVLVILGLFWVW